MKDNRKTKNPPTNQCFLPFRTYLTHSASIWGWQPGFLSLFFAMIFPFVAAAVDCTRTTPTGETCQVGLLKLKPTQMAVGMREVSLKVSEMEEMSEKKFKKYLEDHPVPLVVGPEGAFYMLDHHHLSRALWELGKKEMPALIQVNWNELSSVAFWKEMKRREWIHPYDASGHGPLSEASLPESILGLGDDWYRGLAGFVRKAGGYKKVEKPFADFLWADFFRPRIPQVAGDKAFAAAVKTGVHWARSSEAKHLPGYEGR